jgi:uncharacterized protein with HEPN domain
MRLSNLDFLLHIKDELDFLTEQKAGMTEAEFFQNSMAQRAFIRSLEIIGEAAKRIEGPFRAKYAAVEWSDMAKMRDKLIHHYFGVDYQIVWQVVVEEIPILKEKIEKIIEDET